MRWFEPALTTYPRARDGTYFCRGTRGRAVTPVLRGRVARPRARYQLRRPRRDADCRTTDAARPRPDRSGLRHPVLRILVRLLLGTDPGRLAGRALRRAPGARRGTRDLGGGDLPPGRGRWFLVAHLDAVAARPR